MAEDIFACQLDINTTYAADRAVILQTVAVIVVPDKVADCSSAGIIAEINSIIVRTVVRHDDGGTIRLVAVGPVVVAAIGAARRCRKIATGQGSGVYSYCVWPIRSILAHTVESILSAVLGNLIHAHQLAVIVGATQVNPDAINTRLATFLNAVFIQIFPDKVSNGACAFRNITEIECLVVFLVGKQGHNGIRRIIAVIIDPVVTI